MGLQKNEGRKIFLNISDGKIVRQHQNPIEGRTVTRTNKNGKVVHEEFFSAVSGIVTNIKSKDTPFGIVWEVYLKDEEDEFILSWNYSSRYTNNFFRAAPNVDWSEVLSIHPWSMKDKQDSTKTVIGLSLYQNKEKIEFAYTREQPGKMPDLKKVKIKGKESWDDSAQLEFFEAMVKNDILPKLNGAVAEEVAQDEEEAPF